MADTYLRINPFGAVAEPLPVETPTLDEVLAESGVLTTTRSVTMAANATGLEFKTATDSFLKFVTTGTLSADFAQRVNSKSTHYFGSTGQSNFDASGNMTVSSGYTVSMADNVAVGWALKEGSNTYASGTTTNGSESFNVPVTLKATGAAQFGSSAQTTISSSGNHTYASGVVFSVADNVLPAVSWQVGGTDLMTLRTTSGNRQVRMAVNLNCLTTAQFGSIATFASGIVRAVAAGSGNATLTTANDIYGVTGGTTPTITLPAVAGVATGQTFTVKDEANNAGSNNITIVASGGALINGAANILITSNGGAYTFYMRNGAYWTF